MPPRKPTTHAKQQQCIAEFTQVKKPSYPTPRTKRVDLDYDIIGLSTNARKREASDEDEAQDNAQVSNKRSRIDTDAFKPRLIVTPNRRVRGDDRLPSPNLTPDSHGCSELSPERPRYDSSSPTPEPASDIPAPIQDLINIHGSLLKALSIHIAHHGTTSAIPLSQLLPSVSKIWNKRSINTPDVQRCLSVPNDATSGPPFSIFDFGDLGPCLDFTDTHISTHRESRNIASGLNETHLQSTFTDTLTTQWHTWNGLRSPKPASTQQTDAQTFIDALPLDNIPTHPSLTKSQPTNSRTVGRARLDLLTPQNRKEKHAVTGLLTPTSSPDSDSSKEIPSSKPTPTDRKSSLYERLASKSKSKSVRGVEKPSDEVLKARASRKQALHFLPELIRTLLLLAKGQRKAFGMEELVKVVRGSVRGVVEGEVVRGAVGCLGGGFVAGKGEAGGVRGRGEHDGIAPDFVKVVRIGEGVVGIVVDAGGRPRDLDERVRRAIAMAED